VASNGAEAAIKVDALELQKSLTTKIIAVGQITPAFENKTGRIIVGLVQGQGGYSAVKAFTVIALHFTAIEGGAAA